jgi:uncharacterized radical SAM protein YgiQ
LAQPLYPQALGHPSPEEIAASWRRLGTPRLFVGISTGVVDSMLNNYTANKKIRRGDEYTTADYRRPDYAGVVFAQLARTYFPQTLLIGGGVEISLRRLAHYDFWQNKILPSIMLQAPYDLVLYGMGEQSILATADFVAHHLTTSSLSFAEKQTSLKTWAVQQRGTVTRWKKNAWPAAIAKAALPYQHLPAYREVRQDKKTFMRFSKMLLKAAVKADKILLQDGPEDAVIVTLPPLPLPPATLDRVYELPYTREQHWSYPQPLKSLETVKWSICANRGCFGGCNFCALTLHQGKKVQSRSADSIIREAEQLKRLPGFFGIISDVGGPTANMYQVQKFDEKLCANCERPSCLFPAICQNLNPSQQAFTKLLADLRQRPGIKKVLVASGVRYDLALAENDQSFLRELITEHVGGHLKVAPEHCEEEVLKLMGKPSFTLFEEFRKVFSKLSQEAHKEQYLVPYFISSYPGCTPAKMTALERWCQKEHWNLQQVQNFIPLPMTMAAAMYWCEQDPQGHKIYVPKTAGARFAQRASLQPQRFKKFNKSNHRPKNHQDKKI